MKNLMTLCLTYVKEAFKINFNHCYHPTSPEKGRKDLHLYSKTNQPTKPNKLRTKQKILSHYWNTYSGYFILYSLRRLNKNINKHLLIFIIFVNKGLLLFKLRYYFDNCKDTWDLLFYKEKMKRSNTLFNITQMLGVYRLSMDSLKSIVWSYLTLWEYSIDIIRLSFMKLSSIVW